MKDVPRDKIELAIQTLVGSCHSTVGVCVPAVTSWQSFLMSSEMQKKTQKEKKVNFPPVNLEAKLQFLLNLVGPNFL